MEGRLKSVSTQTSFIVRPKLQVIVPSSSSSSSESSDESTDSDDSMAGASARQLAGKIQRFDPNECSWTIYSSMLEDYFALHDIDDANVDIKRKILLTSIGMKSLKMLWERFNPDAPQTKTYDELCAAMEAHYVSIPITVSERFNFYSRKQKENESPQEYLAELRKLAKNCRFNAFLEEALRDMFVIGQFDREIQLRLLSGDFDLDASFALAKSLYSAASKTKEIRREAPSAMSVHYSSNKSSKQSKSCWRCGNNHSADLCKFKDRECYVCRKMGHIKYKCPEGKRKKKSSRRNHVVC